MVTKEDLEEKYSQLPVSDLLAIIDNKHEYTDIAVLTALKELTNRGVTEDQIAIYKQEQIEEIKKQFKRNYVDGLNMGQKHFFFFFWFPVLTFAFKQNFAEDGYLLKLRQARYYSLCGFISFFIAPVIGVYFNMSAMSILVILIIELLITLQLDNTFNSKITFHNNDEEET